MTSLLFFPHPDLKRKAAPVAAFDERLRILVRDILSVMQAAKAVGLSAAHIGDGRRVVVLDLPSPQPVPMPLVLVNPQILQSSVETGRFTEGSVSMPGVTEEIERPASVSVAYRTETGDPATIEATGFLAACLQHEIDQLDGIFWIERLSRLKRERLVKKYEKDKRVDRRGGSA